ncbi:SEC14-like protein 2 [Caerostris darwini]|uniref:SEC14-like protein 2 n=1 Tax=Caerostris darwini TaxID=1538125 RepID=A0AAV4X763_9ARAC|nr:SEC14-like protein 2 [Caerostris darwini]
MYLPDNIKPEERRVVEELRRRIFDDLPPKLKDDDSIFYRFCKARDFVIEDAEAMLRKHIHWREEYKIDKILTEYTPQEVCKYAPTSFLCFDKSGDLIRYFDFGNTDVKGLFNSIRPIDFLKYCLYVVEQDCEILKEQSKKIGRQGVQSTFICNFENLTFAKATHKKTLEAAILFLKAFQDNYPERIKNMYHINGSVYYTMLMSVLKTFIASPLLQKITIYGTEGWKEDVLQQIDGSCLPAFLGGVLTDPDGNPQCKTFVSHGRKVPEKYYFTSYEKKLSKAPGAKKINVTRFSKEEISFEVQEAGWNLEWEFETKNRDIGFAVYFKENSPNVSHCIELVPKQRIETCYGPEKGLFKCQKAGIYTIVFDNSYSWMYPKEIYYIAGIKNPIDVVNYN